LWDAQEDGKSPERPARSGSGRAKTERRALSADEELLARVDEMAAQIEDLRASLRARMN
jgi:hypothetical protein